MSLVVCSSSPVGFGFGGLLGMFLAGMGSSAPELHLTGASGSTTMTARAQMKAVAQDLAKRTWSSAKSFGKIATIYSASECAIESVLVGCMVCDILSVLV
jgi:import inner membrane translocase subunit TIM22